MGQEMTQEKKEQRALVELTIDGRKVHAPAGSTLWEAARDAGIEIHTLCHSPRMRPVGVCRVCLVDVGERVLAASCVREVAQGMEVRTDTEEIRGHQRTLVQLLLADYPSISAREAGSGDDALLGLARDLDVKSIPYPDGGGEDTGGEETGSEVTAAQDTSSKVILVDHQACILCDRCIRACDDLQRNHVIGRTGKGYGARIAFDLNNPMGQSSCVSCGECMAVCPTGALTDKSLAELSLEK